MIGSTRAAPGAGGGAAAESQHEGSPQAGAERHLRALFARAFAGEQAQFLVNGPLLRLPEEFRLDSSTRMLDIGCRRGALLRAIDGRIRTARPPAGVDPHVEWLRLAVRDEAKARRPRPVASRYAAADPLALPFRDGAFTLVTAGYVTGGLDDGEVDALLREVHRVLEPGGLALLWDFGPTGERRLDAWNARVLALAMGTRPRLRSSRSLTRRALAAGFEFARHADLRPFLVPPIPRASVLLGRPPEGWEPRRRTPQAQGQGQG